MEISWGSCYKHFPSKLNAKDMMAWQYPKVNCHFSDFAIFLIGYHLNELHIPYFAMRYVSSSLQLAYDMIYVLACLITGIINY